jgi:hypothetical protein
MKTKWSKSMIWQSILSILVLAIFVALAIGSDFSQQKKELGNGIWEESKNFSNGKVETITGKIDEYGNWSGPAKITHENEDKELVYTEEVNMVDGVRNGISKLTYTNGVVIEHCYDMGVRKVCEKSALITTVETSAFSVLSYKYPWFQAKLGALNFNADYLKAYMDTVEKLMYKKEFKASEFDTYYNDMLDSLRETRFDSIVTFNSELSMYQGLDLMKNSPFRMAVIDRYRTPESTTYGRITQTYPGYLRELNDSGVVSKDFEVFCHQMDSIMNSYGSLQPNESYFLDSIDARIYRSLTTIINTEKSILISSQMALKSASLMGKKTNLLKYCNDLKSIMNPLSLTSTPSEVGQVVLTGMLLMYIDGDLLRKSFLDACYLNKSVARIPVTTTTLENNSSSGTAILKGNVIEDGGAPVSLKGMAWAVTYNPTINDHNKTSGAGIGEFSITADGLTKGTTYYARSFATNSAGTAYGNCIRFVAGEASGTNELSDPLQGLTIYPNPAATFATFRFSLESTGTNTLSISDLNGREILKKDLGKLPEGNNQIQLNLSGLLNGVYNCRLTDGSSSVTGKLVIAGK